MVITARIVAWQQMRKTHLIQHGRAKLVEGKIPTTLATTSPTYALTSSAVVAAKVMFSASMDSVSLANAAVILAGVASIAPRLCSPWAWAPSALMEQTRIPQSSTEVGHAETQELAKQEQISVAEKAKAHVDTFQSPRSINVSAAARVPSAAPRALRRSPTFLTQLKMSRAAVRTSNALILLMVRTANALATASVLAFGHTPAPIAV
jgi:hypothetical protein